MNVINNTVIRCHVCCIGFFSAQTGVGGVGGLVMTTIHTGTNAGTYLPAYDGNGNVSALVNASNGEVTANYEYGPFGEPIRVSGTMSKENPYRFSTKRTIDSIDIILYEYRTYSPTIGRWLSRDLIDTQDGANIYSFVGNNPLNSFDILGLWDSDVHQFATTRWAKNIGYPDQAANIIGAADESIDHGPTTSVGGDQSYHFNRNIRGGSDTRLDHFSEHIANAKRLCTSSQNDSPKEAAIELGKALHPLQDWVAHGDFGLGMHPSVWAIHNMFSPQRDFGKSSSYPDMTWLDAVGSLDGRPAGAAIQYIGSSVIDYAIFTPGIRRWKLTKEKTESALEEFRNYVNINGGCKCKQFFGAQ